MTQDSEKYSSIEFPQKLLPLLFGHYMYKVTHGGRGSSKSWSFARTLLLLGLEKSMRILCAREYQISIRDSVHRLLSDQIKLLGIQGKYHVTDTEIRGTRNNTLFAFIGLSNLTADSIKSYEGFDICWIEQGETISQRSLDILDPTIRKEGSEIWISFNPDLETDPVYDRFVKNKSDDCIVVEMNWRDNPWWNPLMEKKRLDFQRRNPDEYDNVYEGKCKPAVEGAIYYKQLQEVEAQNRICNVPYDPLLRVHVVLDLGWRDSLGAALIQRSASEARIIEYIEASHTTLDVFFSHLKERPYNWGRVWPPHDAYSGSLNTGGKSTYDILTNLGWDVAAREEITELTEEEGIRNARLTFRRLFFDEKKTNAEKSPEIKTDEFHETELYWRMVEALKRHRRHVNKQTKVIGKPVHDEFSHAGAVLRYICANLDNMQNITPITHFHQNMVVNATV